MCGLVKHPHYKLSIVQLRVPLLCIREIYASILLCFVPFNITFPALSSHKKKNYTRAEGHLWAILSHEMKKTHSTT